MPNLLHIVLDACCVFKGRMTFAFSSFTPIVPPQQSPASERPVQTAGSDRDGPASRPNSAGGRMHQRTYSSSSMTPIKPSLTAQQIYELAMSSTAPSPGISGSPLAGFDSLGNISANSTAPASPVISSSASYHHQRSRSQSRPTTPGLTNAGERISPAVFRPMPDEVYLPFIDRPTEVTALLAEPPTSGLFRLLEALFPADMKKESSHPDHEGENEEFDDPTNWTFEHLEHHLKMTTRDEIDDKAWTDAARACIRTRSEALWERFKGALGVPSELEEAEAEEEELDDGTAMMSGSFIDVVKGHEPPTESEANVGVPFPLREAILEPVFVDQGDTDEEFEEEDEHEGEGHSAVRFSNLPNHSSGALSDGAWSSGRIMENIGEGAEEEEEAKEEDAERAAHLKETESPNGLEQKQQHAEFDYSLSSYLSPNREIRALQITTTPSTGTGSTIAHPRSPYEEMTAFAPASSSLQRHDSQHEPQPQNNRSGAVPQDLKTAESAASNPNTTSSAAPVATGTDTEANASSPPSSRLSQTGPRVVLRRPSETIGQTFAASNKGTLGSSASYEGFGGYGLAPSNRPYHPVLSERGPGNPLFPSSFADLSVAPTLVAK